MDFLVDIYHFDKADFAKTRFSTSGNTG